MHLSWCLKFGWSVDCNIPGTGAGLLQPSVVVQFLFTVFSTNFVTGAGEYASTAEDFVSLQVLSKLLTKQLAVVNLSRDSLPARRRELLHRLSNWFSEALRRNVDKWSQLLKIRLFDISFRPNLTLGVNCNCEWHGLIDDSKLPSSMLFVWWSSAVFAYVVSPKSFVKPTELCLFEVFLL